MVGPAVVTLGMSLRGAAFLLRSISVSPGRDHRVSPVQTPGSIFLLLRRLCVKTSNSRVLFHALNTPIDRFVRPNA
jgi:hypothetical protein